MQLFKNQYKYLRTAILLLYSFAFRKCHRKLPPASCAFNGIVYTYIDQEFHELSNFKLALGANRLAPITLTLISAQIQTH